MNGPSVASGAPARRSRGHRWARWSLAGAAVVGLGVGVAHWWPHEDRLPDFTVHDETPARKAAFFGYLLPRIQAVNRQILADRERLQEIRDGLARGGSVGFFDERWLREIARNHGLDLPARPDVAFADRLLERVDLVPPSLVLAQAATESAFGTSRFARHGNNLFGMRAYNGSGLVPMGREPGEKFTLAAYPSVAASIAAYVEDLNSDRRYQHFRQIRAGLRRTHRPLRGLALADGITAFSSDGADYIDTIQSIIRTNRLEQYDP